MPTRAGDFLSSTAWKRVRDRYRGRWPLCELCALRGLTVGAQCVDHIIPRDRGGALFDGRNLQSLCLDCHGLKTRVEQGRASIRVLPDGTVEDMERLPGGMRPGITGAEARGRV